MSVNGFSTEDDSRQGHDQICCLIDNGERCNNSAGNASYSKRIQKTVQQRKLKLARDDRVNSIMPILKVIHDLWEEKYITTDKLKRSYIVFCASFVDVNTFMTVQSEDKCTYSKY